MDERSRVLMASLLGAVVGGIWGWLYMTENGRRIREQIEPKLDDFVSELTRVRGTVDKARSAANDVSCATANPSRPASAARRVSSSLRNASFSARPCQCVPRTGPAAAPSPGSSSSGVDGARTTRPWWIS